MRKQEQIKTKGESNQIMKIKNVLIVAATVLLAANTAKAEGDSSWNWNDRFAYDRENKEIYRANELTLDLFGVYTKERAKFNDTFDRDLRHGDFGGGLGANYFFTRVVGIGADTFAEDNGGGFFDAVNGSLILRLPMDAAHLAPYAIGGGGRQLEGSDHWTAHAGVGLEFRLNQYTGIFIDGRHVFHIDKGTDYTMLRSGFRIAF